jgi:predicted MFS family arabinose efflux permease
MKHTFSQYQIFVIALLAFLQFTIILDFMILSPLGVLVMKQLEITTAEFGLVVSVYAFSAGISGILAAGFADKFDRKKLLLFFYAGFVIGTVLCGIAPNYHLLLVARIITGIFGGVIGSIAFAIIADLFSIEVRGRVMGFVMTAFATSQVLGIPLGLYISNRWGWQMPFLMIAGISSIVGLFTLIYLRPIDAHLKEQSDQKVVVHLLKTISEPRYIYTFMATMLLATGGFMLMPFSSAFTVHNLGIPLDYLPVVYMVTGITSIIAGPILGRLSDAIGKYLIFCFGSAMTIGIVLYYTSLGITPLWFVILIMSSLFIGITARMVTSGALTSAVPDLKDRGAFMSINSSIQQLSGGIATFVAGLIVVQTPSGQLNGYPILGYVVSTAIFITAILMYKIHLMGKEKS